MTLGVEGDAGKFEVVVGYAAFVAVVEQTEQLPHHCGCCCFVEVVLLLKHGSQGFPIFVLKHNKKAMVVFEEFINLWHGGIVDLLKLMNLLLKLLPLVAAYFVLIDNINGSGEGGLDVYSLA